MKCPYKKYLRFAMILDQAGGNKQKTHYPTPTKKHQTLLLKCYMENTILNTDSFL